MKVEKDWIQRSIVNRYASLRIIGASRVCVHPIEIPDEWVVRVNRAGELTDRGGYYELTRVGWINVKDELELTWGQYAATRLTFAEIAEVIERLLNVREDEFTQKMKKHLLRAKMYGDFVNAQLPYKVNP